jgi:iron-sulfur cluster repair protein YtfE (RIC family)
MGVKSVVKRATAVMREAVGGGTDSRSQDLLDTLKTEHDEVKELLDELQATTASAKRKALVRRLKSALVPHTKAEEKVLYAALIRLRDKDAQTDGHEGNVEHNLAAKTLQALGRIANATSPAHKATAKVLKELVEHHIQEEERNAWSDAKKHFSDDDRIAMNRRYLAVKSTIKV